MSAPVVVTLYRREGCHLCEEVRERLETMRSGGARFDLLQVDIESDDHLHRQMLERIPVIEVDGELVSELGLGLDALGARLGTLSG